MFSQFFSLLVILIYCNCYLCENCVFESACKCRFNNGSVIDLTSIGQHDKARFQNLKAVVKPDNYAYSYNPCFGFKMGPPEGACANSVAVCQYDEKSNLYIDCGDSENVRFHVVKNKLILVYSASQRSTNVTLNCSENAIDPILVVNGEMQTEKYEMTLTSRCACPDLCNSHLSTGSVLVILFMIFVALYLILGIVHSSLTRGAHGWELIPHYEFWSDFPLLVRDGCVFVVSGCKPETAYERI